MLSGVIGFVEWCIDYQQATDMLWKLLGGNYQAGAFFIFNTYCFFCHDCHRTVFCNHRDDQERKKLPVSAAVNAPSAVLFVFPCGRTAPALPRHAPRHFPRLLILIFPFTCFFKRKKRLLPPFRERATVIFSGCFSGENPCRFIPYPATGYPKIRVFIEADFCKLFFLSDAFYSSLPKPSRT